MRIGGALGIVALLCLPVKTSVLNHQRTQTVGERPQATDSGRVSIEPMKTTLRLTTCGGAGGGGVPAGMQASCEPKSLTRHLVEAVRFDYTAFGPLLALLTG